MRTVPFITSDSTLFQRVTQVAQACEGFDANLASVGNARDALEYLDVELPDLAFINFSDPAIDGFALLDSILEDPWLHYASIVCFSDDDTVAGRLETIQGANLVASLHHDDIEAQLPRILGVLVKNQRFLFQRGIGSGLMQTLSGSFRLHNDTSEATCYANLLCNFLYNAGKIGASRKMHLGVAITELLINAIEHGNCEVSYPEKSAWLEAGNTMRALIARKCQDPVIGKRRAVFEYTITPGKSTFLIADEGAGFDWRGLKDPGIEENIHALHGRGITMARQFTRNLQYNARGNEVRFEVEHQVDCANGKPALFANIEPIAIEAGSIVFHEGEPGDFLYFIAKGRFDVIFKDRIVSTLSADDILMGEMAFLLNNRRTATVRATTAGTLIRMSKQDFVEAIKTRPHYGLFLARLLAHRVQRIHRENSAN